MKKLVYGALIILLFYTRFVNLNWGLPYPMHPDERNMAVAVQQLSCPPLSELITNHYPLTTCYNPHFFAYGQLPLYLAYGGIQAYHALFGLSGQPSSTEAVLALRALSALASILLVFVLMRIVDIFLPKSKLSPFSFHLLALLFFIFQPYAIQFSHFGTTESLLMLFYALIIYFSIKLLYGTTELLYGTTIVVPYKGTLSTKHLLLAGLFSGLALGTKTSSILFFGVPILVLLIKIIGGSHGRVPFGTVTDRIYYFYGLLMYFLVTCIFFILSSPQSILNWQDFLTSMNYESAVGLGTYVPFYTRQFIGTTPILFQFTHILPSVLGWPQLILSIIGFIFLPSQIINYTSWLVGYILQVARVRGPRRRAQSASQQAIAALEHRWGIVRVTESAKLFDLLRFALLISFLPPSFFFAKWTRFIAPSFPIFSLFAILFFIHLFHKATSFKFQVSKYVLLFVIILPGFSFLSVYTSPDIRFTASEWIYKNIPENSKILTETANVIDLPIPTSTEQRSLFPTYQINSFNFYDLDVNPQLVLDLSRALNAADYIIIPSRRIFANHTCLSPEQRGLRSSVQSQELSDRCSLLSTNYQLLTTYYSTLFSDASGYELIKEFSSFPRIEFSVLGSSFSIPFNDEFAEETWTVFDHPVIRVYKRMTNDPSTSSGQSKLQISNPLRQSDSEASQISITNKKANFSSYKTTKYSLGTTNYELLVADSPEKWEKGLMYVKNKKDIGGLDGMIFTFPDTAIRTFWNMNTLSHLTLYWMDKGVVVGETDLPSITESKEVVTVTSPKPADAVIEIIK